MPRYVVGTLPEADVNMVADVMRQAGANIIGTIKSLKYKNSSGRFSLECSEELAARLEKTEGVKYFEEAIPHPPVSR